MKYFFPLLLLAASLILQAGPNKVSSPPILPPHTTSKPLVHIAVPKTTRVTGGGLGIGTVRPKAAAPPKAVDMKLLVITVDGTEPSYGAIQSFLQYLGLPYEAVVARTQPLPVLNDTVKGFYQGIILVTGNLGYCDTAGVCGSALSAADWARLDQYAVDFGVRTVSYYTWPEARYGLSYVGATSTSAASPQNGTFLAAATPIWRYLKLTTPLRIAEAYTYMAAVTPIPGATSTPLITLPGGIIANQFLDSDGSESIAMMMDNYSELQHSLLLNYGLINWVTRGKFLGIRRIYLTPQIDDLFLPNDQYVATIEGCRPTGFTVDPTYDPSANCPTVRTTAADLTKLAAWEDTIRADPYFFGFRSSFAFNGYGHTEDAGEPQPDLLMQTAVTLGPKFFQVNHTWDHEHLDCYQPVPNSGVCRGATYQESLNELTLNKNDAAAIGLAYEPQAIVTPNISGLFNPNFMQAARAAGVRYVVGDTSRPEFVPPMPNTGLWNPYQVILMIPRRANNQFYNVSTPTAGAVGSWPDEFNYFYGPQGIFRIGGPGGPPFFTSNLTYAQLLDFEASAIVRNMLKYEIYPVMFHQGNVVHYDGVNSIYRDLMNKVKEKYLSLMRTPVTSLSETDTGIAIIDRMSFELSGVKATWNPGVNVTISVTKTANIPVTGVCAPGCVNWIGDQQSRIRIAAGQTVVVPAP